MVLVSTSTIRSSRRTLAVCGQKVQHVLNGTAPASHRESFEDLGGENEGGDHQGGEKLANRQRGNQGDGHGKLHRHAALENVFECLFENWVASSQRGYQANHAYPAERLP